MNDNRSGGEGLQRKLSPLNVWALALGSIIGWGAFVMPANTFYPMPGRWVLLLLWLRAPSLWSLLPSITAI